MAWCWLRYQVPCEQRLAVEVAGVTMQQVVLLYGIELVLGVNSTLLECLEYLRRLWLLRVVEEGVDLLEYLLVVLRDLLEVYEVLH